MPVEQVFNSFAITNCFAQQVEISPLMMWWQCFYCGLLFQKASGLGFGLMFRGLV